MHAVSVGLSNIGEYYVNIKLIVCKIVAIYRIV
jgi:hypothetical protein